jgi:ribosomal protein S18 acetylase RimI-like enzyme
MRPAIGAALTRHGLTEARRHGFDVCAIDWRETNLLSSRFWRAQEFQPTFYRLAWRLDPRYRMGAGLTQHRTRERSTS